MTEEFLSNKIHIAATANSVHTHNNSGNTVICLQYTRSTHLVHTTTPSANAKKHIPRTKMSPHKNKQKP